jgi:hypothetical protein
MITAAQMIKYGRRASDTVVPALLLFYSMITWFAFLLFLHVKFIFVIQVLFYLFIIFFIFFSKTNPILHVYIRVKV